MHIYRASRYDSEALRLWPQRCNTSKRRGTVVVAVPAELLRNYLKNPESLGKYSTTTLKEEDIEVDHR
jgi:hypothetical protein